MKKISGRKIALSIIIILILLVIALFVGKFTFSYLAPDLGENASNKGEVTASGDTIIFNSGTSLSLSATTDNFKTGGTNLTSTTNPTAKLVASSKTNKADATYYVGVNIKNNSYTYSTTAKTPEIILSIKDEKGSNVTSVNGLTYTTSGGVSGFDVTDKIGLFNVDLSHAITTTSSSSGTTHTWTFTLTFINLSTDQSDNENASMSIEVVLQKDKPLSSLAEVCSGGENLATCITTLSQKSVSGATNIYHHTSTLTNGAGDNSYRYAGASENVNNFVCFGSTTSPCPTDNLYRIIGVFDGKVKLIKYDYANSNLLGTNGDYSTNTYAKSSESTYKGELTTINTYYWNNSTQTNTWSESNLNKVNLNQNFVNNIGTQWANKIAETTWKVGGNTWDNIAETTPSVVYQNEIVSPVTTNTTDGKTEYSAKIGLMYASDYGFAAAQSAWTSNFYDYRGAAIKSVNWMYMGLNEWTISRGADFSNHAFDVFYRGDVNDSYVNSNSDGVRPSFNLSSSITYVSGSGSANNPIVIN